MLKKKRRAMRKWSKREEENLCMIRPNSTIYSYPVSVSYNSNIKGLQIPPPQGYCVFVCLSVSVYMHICKTGVKY